MATTNKVMVFTINVTDLDEEDVSYIQESMELLAEQLNIPVISSGVREVNDEGEEDTSTTLH